LEAGLKASLELQCHETMEIRTKHLGAASRLPAMEIGAKQYDKAGILFWTSKRIKAGAPPQ